MTSRKKTTLDVTVDAQRVVTEVTPIEERAIVTPAKGPSPREAARRNTVQARAAEVRRRRTAIIRQALEKRRGQRQAERDAAIAAAAEAAGDPKDHIEQVYVKASDILVPEEYQRIFDQPRAEGIAMRFKWRRFQAPQINRRPDGTLVAVDGQHRIWAAQRCFGQDVMIPVLLTHVETTVEEAGDFDAVNTERRTLNYNAAFRARVHARDADSLQVLLLLKEVGMRPLWPGENRGTPATVVACRTVEYMIKQGGASSARAVLSVLRDVGGTDPDWYRDFLLAGMWQFLLRYDGLLRRDRLVDVLRKQTDSHALDGLTAEHKNSINSSNGAAACGALHYLYNYRMKVGDALPPFSIESPTRHSALVRRYARQWVTAHEPGGHIGAKPNGAWSSGAQLPYQSRPRDAAPS